MKILILSDGFPPEQQGGAERVAALLALEYRRQGHKVSVVTTTRHRENEGVREWRGVKVYRLYVNYHERWRAYLSIYNPWVVGRVRQIMLNEQPEVVHAHNIHFYLSYHSLAIARKMGYPVILTLHDAMTVDYGKFIQGIPLNDLSDRPNVDYHVNPWRTFLTYRLRYFPLRNIIIRQYLQHYKVACIAVSYELRRFLETNGVQCYGVVRNGVDIQELAVDTEEVSRFRIRFGLQGQKVILFAGRGSFWKGGHLLLRALPAIVEAVPECTLVTLTQRNYFCDLLNQARSLNVADRLVWAGWLQGKELSAAYHTASSIVVPSLYLDPFPTIILEAMAAKKPVIVSCFSGGKEAVIHGRTGYVVNPLNVSVLAQHIVELLVDDEKARKMGESGYQHLLDNFTIERCAKTYLAIFEHFISRS